jgi:hypothetical protein
MVFADAVALAAVYYIPKPVIPFMGGVRLTESESAVVGVVLWVSCLGVISAPVWLIGALYALAEKSKWQLPVTAPVESVPVARSVWALVAISLLIWLPILPFTQSEQQLRSHVERDLKAGRIAEALDVMSVHELSDFPPGWEPPPRTGYYQESSQILDVLDVVVAREVAPWVREEFVGKLRRQFGEPPFVFHDRKHDPDLTRITRILQRLPEGPEIAAEYARYLESGSSIEQLSAEYIANREILLKLDEKSTRPKQP